MEIIGDIIKYTAVGLVIICIIQIVFRLLKETGFDLFVRRYMREEKLSNDV